MLAHFSRTNGVASLQSRNCRKISGLYLHMAAVLWTVVLCATIVIADPDVTNPGGRLVNVAYDKLKGLARNNNYVIALYAKDESQEGSTAETEVAKVRNELEGQFSAAVVKTDSDSVAEEFGLVHSPSLLFFRRENAIIYDGAFQEEALFDWFLQNQEPSVQILTDDNFEHLTQAASGSTTGDWFIMLLRCVPINVSSYGDGRVLVSCLELTKANSEKCIVSNAKDGGNASSSACRALQPTWESVASRLKSRMNVAVVDTDNCPQLEKRFKITKNPELIFFRLGKLYRYVLAKNDIPSLSGFALGWYKNAKAELVPQQDTPFDNIITWIIEKLKTELRDPYVSSPIIMLTLPMTLVIAAVLAKGRDYKGDDL